MKEGGSEGAGAEGTVLGSDAACLEGGKVSLEAGDVCSIAFGLVCEDAGEGHVVDGGFQGIGDSDFGLGGGSFIGESGGAACGTDGGCGGVLVLPHAHEVPSCEGGIGTDFFFEVAGLFVCSSFLGFAHGFGGAGGVFVLLVLSVVGSNGSHGFRRGLS